MIEGISATDSKNLIQASSEFGRWKNHPNADFVRHMSDIASSVGERSFPGGILPIIRNTQIEYYALAGNPQQWRELAIRIRAFAGPTLTNFEPRQSDLQNSDSFESVLIDSGITHVSKFASEGDRTRGKLAADHLRSLVNLIKDQPSVERTLPRPTSRVLWEFDSALLLMDKPNALGCIAYLENNLRLDAENLAFMRVRLHSKFEEWDAIRRKDFFDSLIELKRPSGITELLFEAIYRRDLVPYLGSSTPIKIIEKFNEVIGRSPGTLFDRVPTRYSVASITCFALWFQLTGLGTESELISLREQAKGFPHSDLIEQLLASTEQNELVSRSTTDHLKQILSDTPSKSGLRILATELRNYPDGFLGLDIAEYILGIEGLDLEEAIDDGKPESNSLLGIEKRPENWTDLFDISLQVSVSQLRDLAKHGVDHWSLSEEIGIETGQSISGRLIELATLDHEKALTLTPYIFEVLDSSDSSSLGNIYAEIFDTLMLIDIKSDIVLRTISTALAGCLLNGVSREKYSEILQTLGGFGDQLISSSTLPWITDVLELLVTYPCPVRNELENVWAIFTGEFQRLSARMDADTVEVLKELEQLFGFEDIPLGLTSQDSNSDDSAIINSWINFPSNIVLYSLAGSAAERAARILRVKLPDTEIVTMDAKVNSTQLESSVKSADAVCIAWLKATHSATDAIRDVAGDNTEILYAQGGGSSSMIRAVNQYIDGMN